LTFGKRKSKKARQKTQRKRILNSPQISLIIGDKEVRTGRTGKCIGPHDKNHVLATYHKAGEKEVEAAIEAALKAKQTWEKMPWERRLSIFLKAADLVSGPWRPVINVATMLNQSKTFHQSVIDAACEVIDYLRFDAFFMTELYKEQPFPSPDAWNRIEYRYPLLAEK